MNDNGDPPALKAWCEWFQREKAAGNIRSLAEIMADRHGEDCDCDLCTRAKEDPNQ